MAVTRKSSLPITCKDTNLQDVYRVKKSLMDIQKHLECSICLEMLSNPYSTKCNHQFCWECINRCAKESTNKWLCPLCKSSVSRRSLTSNPKLADIVMVVYGLRNAFIDEVQRQVVNHDIKNLDW